MSIALEGAKIPLNHYFDNKCVHGHARGAQSLANFLKAGWGSPTWIYRKNKGLAQQLLRNYKGVIFFKNCFIREGETGKNGDHIDVWYDGRARTYQNFNGSDEVWFWKLNWGVEVKQAPATNPMQRHATRRFFPLASITAVLAASALTLGTCAGSAEAQDRSEVAPAESARIRDHDFVLRGKVLSYSGTGGDSRLALEEQAPCRLHRDGTGQVRSMQVGDATVFLIECSVEKGSSGDGAKRLCDTTLRGIVVKRAEVVLSDKRQSVGACPPFQWDQKMFAFFAE
jgi:hypothetical protein